MKKTISFVVAAIVSVQFLMAQSVADGIKYLDYTFKSQTARQVLKKNYESNPKDPKAIYWYGQAMIAGGDVSKEDIAAAKSFYQKALTDGVNDPWIWVGIGHMELLEGGDINAAKQKFEQAITATTATRGRNKGKASPEILDAIGRANADGGSKIGDPMYGIEKLKEAIAIDPNTPDHYIHMGICYLKLGGENGGEAVKAFQDAISHDPKCAEAMFRIGRVYASQNNYEAFSKYFDDAITADPNFPDVYLAYFEYYKYKDVNKAKSYLDKFIATADKDPRNDFYLADYLFRAGNYNESIAKAKEIEASAGGVAAVPRLNILYAYDYDRLGDSVQSRSYLEKFFNTAPQTQIQPTDYELAVKVFSKFPGSETTAVGYLEKAIANDTSRV
ncbi:MAG: tetratricopeptide repeat protein, partial [Bacteroidota bacterium]|nr:tetratricopeptide repeat protein [Bacteroidota bacterium]